jgi:hypothetical protein
MTALILMGCLLTAAEPPDAGSIEPADAGAALGGRRPLRPDGGFAPTRTVVAAPSAPTPDIPIAQELSAVGGTTAEAGASRWVKGLNGYAELDNVLGLGTLVHPDFYSFAYGALHLRPGFGFTLAGVRLAATARWSVAVRYTLPDNENGRRASWSDLGLQLSAPELFRHSGLTFTPGFGLTIPLPNTNVATVLTGGARLEWRYRAIELGYRVEVGRPFYLLQTGACGPGFCTIGPRYQLTMNNTLLLEAHPTKRFSFGLKLALDSLWHTLRPAPPNEPLPTNVSSDANARQDLIGLTLFVSFSASRYFGVTLSVSRQVDVRRLYTAPRLTDVENQTLLILGVWGRSDPALSKFWLQW